jgi:hypothetical protein
LLARLCGCLRPPPTAQILAALVEVSMRDRQVSCFWHIPLCARRCATNVGARARIHGGQDLRLWSRARTAPCCAQTARAHTSSRPAVAHMNPYTAHIQARACCRYTLDTRPVRRSRGALSPADGAATCPAPRSLLAPEHDIDHPGVNLCAPCAAIQCNTVLRLARYTLHSLPVSPPWPEYRRPARGNLQWR